MAHQVGKTAAAKVSNEIEGEKIREMVLEKLEMAREKKLEECCRIVGEGLRSGAMPQRAAGNLNRLPVLHILLSGDTAQEKLPLCENRLFTRGQGAKFTCSRLPSLADSNGDELIACAEAND